jgi:hygromycin-B 4-O-kinase
MTEEAQRFVTRTFGDRATRLTPLGAGEWSVAYAFNLDAKPAVIRFGNYVEDFRKDRAMAAYSEKALPVPAVIEIGETDTGFFAVSERAPGQVINDLDATGMRAVMPALLAALDAIRDIKVSTYSGYGRWPPGLDARYPTWPEALLTCNQETSRVPGWRARLAESPGGSALFDKAYATLQSLRRGLAHLLVAVVRAVENHRYPRRAPRSLAAPRRAPRGP